MALKKFRRVLWRRRAKWRWPALFLLLIVAGTTGFLFHRLHTLGLFDSGGMTPEVDCAVIPGVPGPEDLAMDFESGVAYVSSLNRREAFLKGSPPLRGSLFRINMAESNPTPVEVTPEHPVDFRPLGISFHTGGDGVSRLFVINEQAGSVNTVEIFRVSPERQLKYQETISGNALVSPNNIAATGEKQFYVTNDGRSKRTLDRAVDVLFSRATGAIVYYDGSRFNTVASKLNFPNGIAYDEAHSKLWVAETATGFLRSYPVHRKTGALAPPAQYQLGVGLDNLHLDTQGRLWVARHPNLPALGRHRHNASAPSPSEILLFYRNGESTVVFRDRGQQISGATVAAPWDGRFLIGAIAEPHLLLCSPYPPPLHHSTTPAKTEHEQDDD